MAHIEQKQAQHVKTYDVVIYNQQVCTVFDESWTTGGLIQLKLTRAGFFGVTTIEVSFDTLIETLVL